MKEQFFNLSTLPPDTRSDQIMAFSTSGYTFQGLNYDLEANRHLGFVRRSITCLLADRTKQTSDPTVLRLKPVNTYSFNPDGMSGGAAFVIQITNDEAHAYMAGIIVRAGNDDVYIVKIGDIVQCVDKFLQSTEN